MSTWIYLECTGHDPRLRSRREVGQHLYDLPRIRLELAERERLLAAVPPELEYRLWADGERTLCFTIHAVEFLREHPRCPLEIVDEYGERHPIEQPDAPDPRPSGRAESSLAAVRELLERPLGNAASRAY